MQPDGYEHQPNNRLNKWVPTGTRTKEKNQKQRRKGTKPPSADESIYKHQITKETNSEAAITTHKVIPPPEGPLQVTNMLMIRR